MSNSKMLVAVRVRPLSSSEKENGLFSCCHVLDNQIVAIKKEACSGGYLKSQKGGLSEYAFDAAFDERSTQRQVYEITTKPYLKNLIDGYNVTVFAYGATGAGKTHTMMGNSRCDSATNASSEAGICRYSFESVTMTNNSFFSRDNS
jgi:kinesin family protein 18/19